MKVIMVMFDTLNRRHMPPYGCDWIHAPNFKRLAEHTVTFDRSYVCSMPCMPARRDLHTGRPNFLHRGWGPLEPFDDSVPQILREHGVHTHLATDHYHYFEDGGATYHNRYSTWDFSRGQEGDAWMGTVGGVGEPRALGRNAGRDTMTAQDRVNRTFMRSEEQQPQAGTFRNGLDFIRRNHEADNWFLQIETFDPHEPFFTQAKYKGLYREHYAAWRKGILDWPGYGPVTEPRDEIEHLQYEYAALVSMCDAYLGEVLDTMDRLEMWDDTMLVVWTDHGFLLGEHGCWAKCWMPYYEEIAHTPFWVWDPRGGKRGERRQALVQPSIDLGPTLLDVFGLAPTEHMLGHILKDTIDSDADVREAAMFGQFGAQVNVTDGRYVYMRAPVDGENQPLNEYTVMPTRMRAMFDMEELAGCTELAEPFTFTKGCRTMRVPNRLPAAGADDAKFKTALYDLESDPQQEAPIRDVAAERRMKELLVRLMKACDAPREQYERLGLEP